MTDYIELKKLAEKATPGPWWIDSHGMTMMSMSTLEVVFNHPAQSIAVRNEETGNLSHWRNDWDASYIATANPATILALIAENERLRNESADALAVNRTIRQQLDCYVKNAERYRFLRDGPDCLDFTDAETMEEVDAMIDAAMSKGV